MTSIAFAVGVIRLGQRRCLVQELPAIEGLARVDVVCADKTGTLTESGMRVCDVVELTGNKAVPDALAALAAADPRPNASMRAIAETFDESPGWIVTATAPFTSATKWSGVSYADHGNWVIGAPDVLLDPASVAAAQAERIGAQGLRVLLLGAADVAVDHPDAPGRVTPVALVVLEQKIRPDARETVEYFAAQDVSVKVISGDNAVSVGAVAAKLGLHGEAMDARRLPTQPDELAETLDIYTTFGRVRPDQKRAIVHALQAHGHTVAMTGDGVNDVLALKDADIGVAMGAGSPASRAVAQIVLLDNKFATLPYVVGEGRRVIGNIERVANLFLTKTVYSVLLALFVGIECLLAKPQGRSAALPVSADPRHDRRLVHHRDPVVHPVAGSQQRARLSRLRPAGADLGAAVRIDRGHRDFRLLPGGLPGQACHLHRTGPGVDRRADHAAADRALGAGGGGASLPVVAGRADHCLRPGVRRDLQHPVGAG